MGTKAMFFVQWAYCMLMAVIFTSFTRYSACLWTHDPYIFTPALFYKCFTFVRISIFASRTSLLEFSRSSSRVVPTTPVFGNFAIEWWPLSATNTTAVFTEFLYDFQIAVELSTVFPFFASLHFVFTWLKSFHPFVGYPILNDRHSVIVLMFFRSPTGRICKTNQN